MGVLRNSLHHNMLWTSGSSMVGQLALAVLFLVVARLRSPEEFGLAVAVYSLAIISTDVIDFGTTPRSIRERASAGMTDDELTTLSVTRGVLICAGAVAWVIVGTSSGLTVATSAVMALFVAARTTESAIFGRLQAEGRFPLMSRFTVADRVTALVMGSLLAAQGAPAAVCIAGGLTCGAVVASGLALRWTVPSAPTRLRTSIDLRRYWGFGRHYAVSGLVTDLQVLDTAIVAAVGGATAASYFAVGARLTGPFTVLAVGFAAALVPPAAAALVKGGSLRPFLRTGILVVAVSTVSLSVIMVLAPSIVHVTFGEDYLASVPVVQIYAGAAMVVCASQPMARLLQTAGDQRQVGVIVTTGVATGLVLVGLGVHLAGAPGAAAGFLASTLAMFVLLARRMLILARSRRARSTGVVGTLVADDPPGGTYRKDKS